MRLRRIGCLVFGVAMWAWIYIASQAGGVSVAWGGQAATSGKNSSEKKDTLWVIPHTHWEGAVFKTREEYLEMGLPNILKALRLLKSHSEYRFVLDQVAYVKPFLERYPEEEAEFRKLIAAGKLAIVGGTDIMPDVNMPGGESLVRQMLYGKVFYRDKLRVDVTVGWNLDTFGHHAQMPQLLKLAGYQSYWFFRGVRTLDTPSEFFWQGIDGSKIPAFWLPYGYGLFYQSAPSPTGFERFARERFGTLTPFAHGSHRVALAGADVAGPEEHLPEMVEEFNQRRDEPFVLRIGLPTDFEAAIARRADRPVVSGELNPIFQGIYSSRIELKQRMRDLERLLTNAEKLAVLAEWLGERVDPERLTQAWEPVLFNQTHDLASGVMVDKVYDDVLRGYSFSERLGNESVEAWWNDLTSRIDTRGEGIPVAVFNVLGWPRTDVVELTVGLAERGLADLTLTDAAGRTVPFQLLQAERYGDGGIERARIAFVARDVPALGYALYRLIPKAAAPAGGQAIRPVPLGGTSNTAREDSGSIENEYYRATFNLWTGEMTSLVDKSAAAGQSSGWEVLKGPGNVVALEQDGGDLWQLYGTLNGGRNIAMSRKVLLPAPERSKFSNEWVGGSGATRTGPVLSEFSVGHPFGRGSFATRVRLVAGIRRVDIQTRIRNNDELVRYRVLFPTTIQNGRRMDEIPFGAIERPEAQEFPAQNWIEYGDGTRGVALLNRGMPGNNVADGTLMLSLMRSARITAYAYSGGYEAGVSSDTGLELGKELTFDYAVVPHAGDWRDAGIFRAGWEFNNPLVARKLTSHAGSLPARWGLLEVSALDVVVSTLKPGRDGSAILRVYEAAGRPSPGVRIKVRAGIVAAHEANLIEDRGRELQTPQDTLQFDLSPYEIKTFKLRLRPFASQVTP